VYGNDGVFMPDHIPTSSGTEIRGAYVRIFDTIKLDVEFHYDKISVHDDLAVAHTHSEGRLTVLADDAVVEDEQNRELFVLARRDAGWKIASYMFNKPF
jgi:ketosteroid isomerase-like protein